MKKVLLILVVFFFLFKSPAIAADENFDISVDSNYKVNENGYTKVVQKITIENKTDYYYTPSYAISVGFKDIENIKAYNSSGPIPFTLNDIDDNNKEIKLKFEKRFAGLGTKNNFTLEFETSDIIQKKNNIWEVTVPGILSPDDFSEYNITVTAPDDFLPPAIVKPKKNTINGKVSFGKNEIGKSGIYLIYGKEQFYSFTLTYNISNPNLFPVKTEVALPPDTNYQKVLINSFSEPPNNVKKDHDGNWIAEYSLIPQQKKTIKVSGFIRVKSSPEKADLTEEMKRKYLQPQKYWDVESKQIQEAAKDLKNAQDVYNFVTKALSYNFEKVTGDNTRLGGEGALTTPINSVCLEFTDLFITLARSIGIPARAVEGYAHTENSTLRPLSLVEDVLHSWPEYYDYGKKSWIMVDPTWGNTTKGMDYYNSLDFDHVAFVIKGLDSEYPIPAGGYKFESKSKDVLIEFAKEGEFKVRNDLKIDDTFPDYAFPTFSVDGDFIIRNSGNSILSRRKATVSNNGNEKFYEIEEIPPGGNVLINMELKADPFLTNKELNLKIQIDNFKHLRKVKISYIPEVKYLILFGGVIIGSVSVAAATYYTGSLFIQRRRRKNSLRR